MHPSFAKYERKGLDYHWQLWLRQPPSTYRIRLLEALDLLPRNGFGLTLLDFGCGTGVPAHILAARHYVVTGYDIYAPAIAEARRRVPDVTFTDVCPDSPFDFVLAHNVIEHVEDTETLLVAIRSARMLSVITTAQPGHDHEAVRDWTRDELAAALGPTHRVDELRNEPKAVFWRIVRNGAFE